MKIGWTMRPAAPGLLAGCLFLAACAEFAPGVERLGLATWGGAELIDSDGFEQTVSGSCTVFRDPSASVVAGHTIFLRCHVHVNGQSANCGLTPGDSESATYGLPSLEELGALCTHAYREEMARQRDDGDDAADGGYGGY